MNRLKQRGSLLWISRLFNHCGSGRSTQLAAGRGCPSWSSSPSARSCTTGIRSISILVVRWTRFRLGPPFVQRPEILPSNEIFPSVADGFARQRASAFSNEFRYKLLFDRGGWWTDLDSVCLRPLEFRDEHVLGYEREPDGRRHVATALFKAPVGSPLMEYCWERCRQADRSRLRLGRDRAAADGRGARARAGSGTNS